MNLSGICPTSSQGGPKGDERACLVSRCANEAPKPVSSNLLLQSIVISFEEVPGTL
jgi:hypothetical protein